MKIFLKVLVNILIALFILVIFDIVFFYTIAIKELKIAKLNNIVTDYIKIIPKYSIKLIPFKNQYKDFLIDIRPVMNAESKEDSIVIFGCSYAYGYIFENKKTISYIMSKYSTRPIYNRAYNGWGIQHVLYQLKDKDFYKEIKTNPKYVFYILIDDISHFQRLYYTAFPTVTEKNYYLRYKKIGNELTERKPFLNLYYNFAVFRYIHDKLVDICLFKNFPQKEIIDLFVFYFKTINNLIIYHWGGGFLEKNNITYPKLVILTFENTQKELWADELQKEGIDVIDISQTIGKKDLMNIKNGLCEPEIFPHPNEKLWELLVPKLKEIYPDL